MDGASFLNSFRERLQEKREAKKERQLNSGNASNALDQARADFSSNQMNPASNGTGSARPNFGQFAQDAIGNVMGGQKMGDALGFRQGGSDKLDKVLASVEGGQSGNDVPQDASTQPQAAPMPPTDPMTDNNPDMGMSMAAKPKQVAKAQAKAYADKKGIRGKARKEMVKDAKRSQSFDAAAQDEKSGDKPVDFGGSMKYKK